MPHKILHVTLEYKYGIGGLKAVVNGLLPVLKKQDLDVSVITPCYDFFNFTDLELEEIGRITHIYKKISHTSIVFCVKETYRVQSVPHYLIKPNTNSPVESIFDIRDAYNIYKAFSYSEPQNRLEYFNSAVASLVRINHASMPVFDIVHTHTWHTSLSVCLIKEFESLEWVINTNLLSQLNPTPKVITTIHMLSEEQGRLIGKREISDTLQSVGLPLNSKFLIDHKDLNQMYLGMQYADQVVMVSKGFAKQAVAGRDYGLGSIFTTIHQKERLQGITNGNSIIEWDASLTDNLGSYAINTQDVKNISISKQKIKLFLSSQYTQLNQDPKALWFLYVGRFAPEKGIDMLPHAYEEIIKHNGNLIIMGLHVVSENDTQCKITQIIKNFKTQKNVLIIDDKLEQDSVGKYFRAASEFTIIPSHFEACGLVPMEAMASCSIPITSDVQGLPDTIRSLIDNINDGTGFIYHDDETNGGYNLKQIILIAISNYQTWQQDQQIDLILHRLHKESAKFDWNEEPVKNYLTMYNKTLQTSLVLKPHIDKPFPIIKVLHIALEYHHATVGGLGSVTTQLITAQNEFEDGTKIESSIITPYYSLFNSVLTNITLVTTVTHLYNNEQVESSIYLTTDNNNKHFLAQPQTKYYYLFNINSPNNIYSPDYYFLERIKYFNSAVAAFIVQAPTIFDPQIIQLHEWPVTLSAMLLKEKYQFNKAKIIYTVHISNIDTGVYDHTQLDGIGLDFNYSSSVCPPVILKQKGIIYADHTVGVSPNVLIECATLTSQSVTHYDTALLARSFFMEKIAGNFTGILNGINYQKYCPIGKLICNPNDILTEKKRLKERLAKKLASSSVWQINPSLPIILYVGRFSPEKGIDCFKDLIEIINNRAIFFAIGKGIPDEILQLIFTYSRRQDNVFITFSEKEQEKYGTIMRSAADFIFVPSHHEACGLVAMEGFANGSLCITSGVGGLKDFITPFNYHDNNFSGNGFFYKDKDPSSLAETVNRALDLWSKIPDPQKNNIHLRIMEEAKRFDWLAKHGAVQQYWELFKHLITFKDPKKSPPRLTIKH